MMHRSTWVFLLAGLAACARVDGAPVDQAALNEKTCVVDRDCGVGRYCGADKLCSIDCVETKDCSLLIADPNAPNTLSCSPCGRCLPEGESDERCVNPTAISCTTDAECSSTQGEGFVCTSDHVCEKSCASDDDCAALGHGWTCGAGVCQELCARDADCIYHGWGNGCSLPPGTDQTANFILETPVMGTCQSLSGGVDYGSTASTDGPGGAYQGVWGWLLVVSVRTTGIPIITQENTAASERLLVKITHDEAGRLTLSEKWCEIVYKNFLDSDQPLHDLAPTISPDRYVASLPILQHHTLAAPALSAGAMFDTDSAFDVRGAILPDPVSTPLPSYKNLMYSWDEDHDSHPGMTITLTGIADGDIYQTIRWSFVQHLGVVDQDHLAGLIDTIDEQTTLGATTPDLIYDLTTVAHPVADRSYFRAVRLSDTSTCDDVIAADTPGGWLAYYPHFDPTQKP